MAALQKVAILLATIHSCPLFYSSLVIPSSLLASLQLLHIPTTNIHVPIILVHATREVLDINGTRASSFLTSRSLGVVHATVGWGVVVHRLLLFGRCSRGTAAEEATNCVAYAGADCDTTEKS